MMKSHFPPPFRPYFRLYQRLQRSKVTLLAGSQQSLAPLRDCTNFMHRTITGKPSNLQQWSVQAVGNSNTMGNTESVRTENTLEKEVKMIVASCKVSLGSFWSNKRNSWKLLETHMSCLIVLPPHQMEHDGTSFPFTQLSAGQKLGQPGHFWLKSKPTHSIPSLQSASCQPRKGNPVGNFFQSINLHTRKKLHLVI